MNGRHNRVVIVVLLVVVFAVVFSWPLLQGRGSGGASVAVLVTREGVPAGTPIALEMLDERRLPATPALDELVTAEDIRRGVTTVRSMRPNEALTFASIVPEPSTVIDQRSGTAAASTHWRTAVAGVTALSVLALLSVLLVAVRRRRVARRSSMHQTETEHEAPEAAQSTSSTRAPSASLLQWAHHELTLMLTSARIGDRRGMPLLIELSQENGVELLWTEPNPRAPAPWQETDGGWSWRLDYDEQPLMLEDSAQPALPMLVEVGTRLGHRLLLNLDALGSIAIDAPVERAREFVQSIMNDLAAGGVPFVGRVVWSADVSSPTELHPRAERDLNGRIADAIRAADSSPSGRRTSSCLGVDRQRESFIASATAADVDSTVLREVRPGTGICVLLLGPHPDSAATIRIDETGRGILEPFGLRFECAEVASSTSEGRAEPLEDEPDQLTDEPTQDVSADVGAAERPTSALSASGPWVWPEPQVLVRVLGAPEVIGYPELGRIETSILAYLACHGGQRTADQIVNAVWNGRLVEPKTLWNKISKIRSVLGPELVPPRQPNSAKVMIADSVMTDLGLLRLLVDRSTEASAAEAVSLLIRGLDLIDGTPFDSSDYEWAYETQQHSEACELVETAAIRCARLSLELGEISTARVAVAAGLRALPANEPLYRARMRVESSAGSPEGVRRTLAELRTVLAAESDGTEPAEPDSVTLLLAAQLTTVG